jgi:hypothetical protein
MASSLVFSSLANPTAPCAPVDIRPHIAGFSWLGCSFGLDSRLLLKHPTVLFGSLSVPSVPGGAINSGDNSNSVGGVPVDIRPRIAGFLWRYCGFGLDSRLLLNHHAVGVPVNIWPRMAGLCPAVLHHLLMVPGGNHIPAAGRLAKSEAWPSMWQMVMKMLSQCIQYPVPVLHSRLYYSLTIRNAQDQSCSNQEQ